MNTKLGAHVGTGSRNGYGDVAPHIRGVVVFDNGGSMDEITDDCYRLFRPSGIYEWPPGSGNSLDDIMPGFDQLTMEDMSGQAAYWWPIFRAEIDRVSAAHGRIDATQITNEAGGNDPFQLKKKYLYEKHMGILAARDGYVITVGNEAVNSPDWTNYLWQSLTAPHVVEMWALGHPYCRHAYADKVDGVSRLIVNGKPAGEGSARPFKEIEFFRKEFGYCGAIILGEIGFVSYPGDSHFMQEITAYDTYMQQWPEIGYGAIFEYGDWNNGKANIQTSSAELSTHLKDNPFTKWIPQLDTEPPPTTGKHKAIVVKIPQDATLAEYLKAAEASYKNRHTFTLSHDDTRSLLQAGNADSYVKFADYKRDRDTVKMVEDLGYRWESLYHAAPPVVEPPPVGGKIDLLPYIKGDGRLYEVRNTSGSQERFQTQFKGGDEFWQTKNGNAEQFIVDAYDICRGWDTSPGNGRYYVQQKSGYNFAEWLPLRMAVGESFTVSLHVQFYTWDCKPSAANSGNVTDTRTLVEHLDSWTSPYGVTVQDVIVIKWVNGGEYYYYARDFGLVAWGRTHNDPNTPMASAISEIHAAGARPDNVVNLPPCLA